MRKHNFKELKIWKRSKNFVLKIFKITKNFPNEEKFGLISQMRRAAISIPSNIAEGCGRGTNPQLNQFLNISQGSAFELETQIIISHELGFIKESDFNDFSKEITEIQNMIFGFQKTLS